VPSLAIIRCIQNHSFSQNSSHPSPPPQKPTITLHLIHLIHLIITNSSMRSFPHETLLSEQLSLSEFTYEMQRACRSQNRLDLVNAALCGRVSFDDRPHRIRLNARQDLDHPDQPTITRDYDSAIGITRNLPFTAAFNIYPVPAYTDTLRKGNHVLGPIYASASPFHHPPFFFSHRSTSNRVQTTWSASFPSITSRTAVSGPSFIAISQGFSSPPCT
jgi:hypothetical protein